MGYQKKKSYIPYMENLQLLYGHKTKDVFLEVAYSGGGYRGPVVARWSVASRIKRSILLWGNVLKNLPY